MSSNTVEIPAALVMSVATGALCEGVDLSDVIRARTIIARGGNWLTAEANEAIYTMRSAIGMDRHMAARSASVCLDAVSELVGAETAVYLTKLSGAAYVQESNMVLGGMPAMVAVKRLA